MNLRQRVALLLAAVALIVLAGCTQPSGPGGPGASNQPAVSVQPAASSQPASSGGYGDGGY